MPILPPAAARAQHVAQHRPFSLSIHKNGLNGSSRPSPLLLNSFLSSLRLTASVFSAAQLKKTRALSPRTRLRGRSSNFIPLRTVDREATGETDVGQRQIQKQSERDGRSESGAVGSRRRRREVVGIRRSSKDLGSLVKTAASAEPHGPSMLSQPLQQSPKEQLRKVYGSFPAREERNGRARLLGSNRRPGDSQGRESQRECEGRSKIRRHLVFEKSEQIPKVLETRIVERRHAVRWRRFGGRVSIIRKHTAFDRRQRRRLFPNASRFLLKQFRYQKFKLPRRQQSISMLKKEPAVKALLLEKSGRRWWRVGSPRRASKEDMYNVLEGIGNSLDPTGGNTNAVIDTVHGASDKQGDEDGHPGSAGSKDLGWADLPLSPLMHPRLIQARTKWHARKPLPSKDPTDFESRLNRNPYAKLLTESIRVCRLTGARLPSSLLVRFTLLRHPETGKYWQLPISYFASPGELGIIDHSEGISARNQNLSKEDLHEAEERPNILPSAEINQNALGDSQQSIVIANNSTSLDSQDMEAARKLSDTRPQRLSSNYMIATRGAMDKALKVKASQLSSLYPLRWKDRLGSELLKNGYLREDMGTFIHQLMQKKVKRLLIYTALLGNAYLTLFQTKKHTRKDHFKAGSSILWLRGSKEGESKQDFSAFVNSASKAYDCSVRAVSRSSDVVLLHCHDKPMLPVFNLQSLLNESAIEELKRRYAVFECHVLYVAPKHTTAKLIGWLWRLVGYGAEQELIPDQNIVSFSEDEETSAALEVGAREELVTGENRPEEDRQVHGEDVFPPDYVEVSEALEAGMENQPSTEESTAKEGARGEDVEAESRGQNDCT